MAGTGLALETIRMNATKTLKLSSHDSMVSLPASFTLIWLRIKGAAYAC